MRRRTAACGGGPSSAHPSESLRLPGSSELTLDAAHSRVEVAGSDRVSGEHVATIDTLDAEFPDSAGVSAGEVVIVADLRTLTMKSKMVEEFVKSEDFLDVRRFPKAVFRSSEVHRDADDAYTVRGVLDLHGVARQIEFVARVAHDPQRTTLRADFLLPRQAFQIRRRDGWDFLISDDFRVKVELTASRRPSRSHQLGRLPELRENGHGADRNAPAF